jgi:hypothetical protein
MERILVAAAVELTPKEKELVSKIDFNPSSRESHDPGYWGSPSAREHHNP